MSRSSVFFVAEPNALGKPHLFMIRNLPVNKADTGRPRRFSLFSSAASDGLLLVSQRAVAICPPIVPQVQPGCVFPRFRC